MEEIASITKTSIQKARTHVSKGIEKRIILGYIENDMFVRSKQRDPNMVLLDLPEDEIV
jgi:hypothetical protein